MSFISPVHAASGNISVLLADGCINGTISGTEISITDALGIQDRLSGNCNVNVSGNRIIIGPSAYAMPVKLSSASPIAWNGTKYYGDLLFKIAPDGFSVGNDIDIELYLLGVVKGEMSDKWPMEALKAQAVIARTYVLSACGKHSGYDVCATNHCQVYKGINGDAKSIEEAVNSTRGMILRWQGAPASVFYHSDSGGMTTAAARVWGSDIPYLRGSLEPVSYSGPNTTWHSTIPMSFIESRLKGSGINVGTILSITPLSRDESGRILTIEVGGTNGTQNMTGHRFRTVVGADKIKSTLFEFSRRSSYSPTQQPQTKTQIQTKTPPSRPAKIDLRSIPEDPEEKLVWLTKHKVFTTQELMEMLSNPAKIDSYIETGIARAEGRLPMPYATVGSYPVQGTFDPNKIPEYEPSSFSMESGTGSIVDLYGRGSGHGVGLSQWGAKTLAERGWDYRQILEHYFPGTTIGQ